METRQQYRLSTSPGAPDSESPPFLPEVGLKSRSEQPRSEQPRRARPPAKAPRPDKPDTHKADAVKAGVDAYPTIAAVPLRQIGLKTPFRGKHLILVPHLRESAVAMVEAIIRMGADPVKMTVLFKAYHYPGGDKVQDQIRRLGVEVVTLERKAAVLARIKARLLATGGRAVVYDDGAEVIPHIVADLQFARLVIGFVEQTTRGRYILRHLAISQPVLSLPDSEFKQTFECGSVGQAGVDALAWHLQGPLSGKRLAVMGAAGVIGQAFAKEAAARGMIVRGFDPAPKDRYFALNSFPLMRVCETKAEALFDADIIVGATGTMSLSFRDLPLLKAGAVLASMSSGQVELPLYDISASAVSTEPFRAAPGRTPHGETHAMPWGRKITVLDGGRPLNLGVAAGPEAACFDLVMAVILVGLAEIADGAFDGQAGLLNVFDDLIQRHDLAADYMARHADVEDL